MKSVLFITYFWPPSGKASLHWPLFVMKHLPSFGWKPFVLTASEDTFSHQDPSLLREVEPSTEVVKTSANDPFGLYRRLLGKKADAPLVASEAISTENRNWQHRLSVWIRMNLFVPDARVGWVLSAVKGGRELLRRHHIDAIVSVGPPHSAHLIGKRLSEHHHIPHVPVLIDPWVDIVYYNRFRRNPLTVSIDNRLERSTMHHAAKAIFVTETTRHDFLRKYPWLEGKTEVLYWGYNEESFASVSRTSRHADTVVLHAGNLFGYQDPVPLWRSIKSAAAAGRRFRIRLVGTVDPAVQVSLRREGLSGMTEHIGFLPYREVVQEMMNADYLVVCASEKRHVPGKLFEYLRSGRPIIAFGDDNQEVQKILENANAGRIFPYAYEKNDIFDLIPDTPLNPSAAAPYDRRNIAASLAAILTSAASPQT